MSSEIKPPVVSSLLGDRIFVLKGKQNKDDVFKVLIDSLSLLSDSIPRDDLEWGILHREAIMSTGIGNGIAVPHVRLENVDQAALALAVCPDGVTDYQTPDNQPVRLVFMIMAGGAQRAVHLKILAAIGSLFYDGRLKAAFLASPEPRNCREILLRAES